MYDVIISGYYGFENSGDDAILSTILTDLRKRKETIKILVLSNNPEATKKQYRVDAIKRTALFPIWAAMRKSKLFINGGGSLIQDVTSSRSIVYYLGVTYMAGLAGMKVMLYANGIGPVNRGINRKLTRLVLNRCDYITLRENSSAEELKSLRVTNPTIEVTADPALNLMPCSEARAEAIFCENGLKSFENIIGFSIRNWKKSEDFIPKVAALADEMAEKYGAQPVFLCLQYPKDIETAKNIVKLMKQQGYIIKTKSTAEEIIGMVSHMELLVSMRLHALIYAAANNISAIGLVYDPKIMAFAEYVGQEIGGDVENLDYDVLLKKTENLWNKKDLADDREKNEKLKKLAMRNADIAILLLNSDT